MMLHPIQLRRFHHGYEHCASTEAAAIQSPAAALQTGGPFERQSTLHDYLSPRARRQRAAELEDEDAPSPQAPSEQAGRVSVSSHAPSPQAPSEQAGRCVIS
jgi:hypothetical protein